MADIIDLMAMAEPQPDLHKRLLALVEKLGGQAPDYCLQCAKCTSGCPAMKQLENMPHEVVSLVRLGFIDELVGSDIIWACTACLKCRERCPQKVAPVEVFLTLRNMAILSGGQVPEGYTKILGSILERGLIQSPQVVRTRGLEARAREDLKLSPEPKPTDLAKFQAALTKALQESL
ncbi:MAG: 4Fe-4S dicluster domain-containing protein [Candidatus Geothermarchaeales archaeon]